MCHCKEQKNCVCQGHMRTTLWHFVIITKHQTLARHTRWNIAIMVAINGFRMTIMHTQLTLKHLPLVIVTVMTSVEQTLASTAKETYSDWQKSGNPHTAWTDCQRKLRQASECMLKMSEKRAQMEAGRQEPRCDTCCPVCMRVIFLFSPHVIHVLNSPDQTAFWLTRKYNLDYFARTYITPHICWAQ